MNIFFLDYDPVKCAQMHCDKHVVKMITETAQLLSNAYHVHGEEGTYKLTHRNHPCSVWAAEKLNNWIWLKRLGLALYYEYKHRYNGKTHKAGEVIKSMTKAPKNMIASCLMCNPPQVMPDEFKIPDDTVMAYRNYYLSKQSSMEFKYTNREVPDWLKEEIVK